MADTNTAQFCWVLTMHQALGTLPGFSALLAAVKCVHTQQLPLLTVPACLYGRLENPMQGKKEARGRRLPPGGLLAFDMVSDVLNLLAPGPEIMGLPLC